MRHQKLPIEALERIDDRCAEFERQWQSEQRPSIESTLIGESGNTGAEDDSVERNLLLAELVMLDVDYRRRRGENPTETEYLERFPEDSNAIREALNSGDKSPGAFEPPSVERLSTLFPSLQMIELIGVGGMGAVYKVRQEGLDRWVALKVLPEPFGNDGKSALRFTREARTLAKMNHPNIVSVYEFGNVDDTYYFLMEYVEGSTLRDLVAARQLTPEHALAIVPQLCDALQFAHDKGVVHRDIKPENILMSVDGSVKIADFGLARILGNDDQPSALTATHQVMGTPRYMAPEQFEGARGVDHRADIYSLGVVIYEMLTGELPIGRFAAPSVKAEIDVRLDEVVLRTLEKEPKRRYQHASHLKSDVLTITSTDHPGLATTRVCETQPSGNDSSSASVQQQELAGRLLLTRRQLMERVESALRPLFRGQIIQILIGIALIALGAQCWAPNTHLPHRLACGVIVHVYGVLLIAAAAAVCTRVKRIDCSKPVTEIRDRIDRLRFVYLRVGPVAGFPWWLMWIPCAVAMGLDVVLHPNCLIVSLIVGVLGLVISVAWYARLVSADQASGNWPASKFAGSSIAEAYRGLAEIESAQIN